MGERNKRKIKKRSGRQQTIIANTTCIPPRGCWCREASKTIAEAGVSIERRLRRWSTSAKQPHMVARV